MVRHSEAAIQYKILQICLSCLEGVMAAAVCRRRLYTKKCDQLFEEKANTEFSRLEQLTSAKQTMKVARETLIDTMLMITLSAHQCQTDDEGSSRDTYRPDANDNAISSPAPNRR